MIQLLLSLIPQSESKIILENSEINEWSKGSVDLSYIELIDVSKLLQRKYYDYDQSKLFENLYMKNKVPKIEPMKVFFNN